MPHSRISGSAFLVAALCCAASLGLSASARAADAAPGPEDAIEWLPSVFSLTIDAPRGPLSVTAGYATVTIAVTSNGSVTATGNNDAMVIAMAGDVTVSNAGTIQASAGTYVQGGGNALSIAEVDTATVTNTGTISGRVGDVAYWAGNGVVFETIFGSTAQEGAASTPVQLTNSGIITGGAGSAVYNQGPPMEYAGNGVLAYHPMAAAIVNSGQISGSVGSWAYASGNGVVVAGSSLANFNAGFRTGSVEADGILQSVSLTNSGMVTGRSGDDGYVSGNGVLIADAYNVTVTNSGTISGGAGSANQISAYDNGNGVEVWVPRTVTLSGKAKEAPQLANAVTVANSGTISGAAGLENYMSGNGVEVLANGRTCLTGTGFIAGDSQVAFGRVTVTNSGTISGRSGDEGYGNGNGVLVTGVAEAVLTNSGAISGASGSGTQQFGMYACGNGVLAMGIETVTLTNSGSIAGRSGNDGYVCGNGALIAGFVSAAVTNSGTISGTAGTGTVGSGGGGYLCNGNGVKIAGYTGTMTAMVTNSGTITGSAGGGGQTYSGNGIVVWLPPQTQAPNTVLASSAGEGGSVPTVTTTVTNSGTISGSGGSGPTCGNGVLLTDGTVNNTGTITGTNMGVVFTGKGNSTVNTSGIIRGGTGPAIQMGAGDDTVNITGGQIFGNIDGGEGTNELNCTLNGTFTCDYNITNFCTANINVGTLVMNGELHATSVYLQSGGILCGTGTIYGDISGPGYISPGHSVGTINVVGNVTSPGGMIIQFNDTSADLLNVTGTANLTGTAATVEPDGLVKVGGRRTVVAAGGGVSGEFGPVTPPASIFLATSFTYDPNHAYLDIDRLGFGDPRLDLNHNQRQIGNDLEASLDSPGMQTGLLLLQGYTSQTDYREALDQLSPELYDVWAKNVFAGAQLQGENLERRLFEMRYAMPGSDFAKLFEQEPDDSTALASTEAGAPAGKSPEGALSDDKRIGVWGMGGMRFGHQGTQRDRLGITQVGFDSRTESGTVGGDYRLTKNFILGLAGSLSFCDIDVRRYGSEASVQSVCVGPYMTYFYDHWYADASVSVGVHNFDMDRRIKFVGFDDMAEGDSNGLSVATNIGGGYMFQANDWVLGPTGYMRYTWLSEDGFTEKGGDWAALRILDRKVDSLRSEIGFRAGYGWKMDWGKLVPEFRARWAHEYLDGKRDIQGQFLASLAGPFTVLTAPESRDSALVGVGLTAHLRKDMAAFVNYDLDVGAKSRLNHGGNLGLRVRF